MATGHPDPSQELPRIERGVLFADVSNSTRLFHELGDDRGRAIVVAALAFARQIVDSSRGRVVDSIGDELFCEFPDADATARAGVRLQQTCSEARCSGDLPAAAHFRVGLHFGPVGVEGLRIYGDSVHLARRVASLAKPEQVLTTADTLKRLTGTVGYRFVERTHVKGRPDPVEVVELVWGDAMTVDARRMPGVMTLQAATPLHRELVLATKNGKDVVVSLRNPSVTLGRDPDSDVWIDDAQISRLHARVEWRRNGFVLVDVSRNGSTVSAEGAKPHEVRRDEWPLGAAGQIQLGAALPLISFRTRTSE